MMILLGSVHRHRAWDRAVEVVGFTADGWTRCVGVYDPSRRCVIGGQTFDWLPEVEYDPRDLTPVDTGPTALVVRGNMLPARYWRDGEDVVIHGPMPGVPGTAFPVGRVIAWRLSWRAGKVRACDVRLFDAWAEEQDIAYHWVGWPRLGTVADVVGRLEARFGRADRLRRLPDAWPTVRVPVRSVMHRMGLVERDETRGRLALFASHFVPETASGLRRRLELGLRKLAGTVCRARKPQCRTCPIQYMCATGIARGK